MAKRASKEKQARKNARRGTRKVSTLKEASKKAKSQMGGC